MRRDRFCRAFIALFACGCVPVLTGTNARPGTSATPWEPWVPPPELLPKVPEKAGGPNLPPELPIDRLKAGEPLTLADVVAVALRNNPVTEQAWLRAQQQAAVLGQAKSYYWPTLSGNVEWLRQRQAALGGRFNFQQTVLSPELDLSWILFDFGGRGARVESAMRALVAANLTQDRVLQDTVLAVEQAYVQYLDAKALAGVQETTVATAQASVAAADARLKAGLATKADLLQAKTALSQAQLNQESLVGQVGTVKGSLATAMGLPANIPVEVGVLPPEVPAIEVAEAADVYLKAAMENRPDLAAARAQAESAAAQAAAARATLFPQLSVSGTVDNVWFLTNLDDIRNATNFSGTMRVDIPIFNGFQRRYAIQQNEALAQEFRASAAQLEQQVVLQVWTSWYALRTASRQLAVAKDLLASAQESYEVARGRYQEGVGTILDLLTAQGALASARATEVRSRTAFFLALAQLAHDTGVLRPPEKGKPLPALPGATP